MDPLPELVPVAQVAKRIWQHDERSFWDELQATEDELDALRQRKLQNEPIGPAAARGQEAA
jgi:hypothetical protein